MRIPAVGRLERNLVRRDLHFIHRNLVNRRVRLEDADFLDRKDAIEQWINSGVFGRRNQHRWLAIRQDRRFFAAVFKFLQHLRNFRVSVELQIQSHQLRAQTCVLHVERAHRIIEGIAGYLPEILMPPHQTAQPSVLELLLPP